MQLVLVIAALILEILATFNIPSKINLVAAGLACYFGSLLVGLV